MKAIQIVEETGPDSALRIVELPEPTGPSDRAPGPGVTIDVRAAGVSFPELLQTRGAYQIRPDLPFIPGGEVAGVVREAPPESPLRWS
jgi:NADPH2:quinone reductase